MVRKPPQLRAPAASGPVKQQRRGKRSQRSEAPLLATDLSIHTTGTQLTGVLPAVPARVPPVYGSSAPAVLGAALHRMGVLPVLPALSKPRLKHIDAAKTADLAALNDFLDKSYQLQQRGHQLWVQEQIQLQRGVELCILGAPCQLPPPSLQPDIPSQQFTPSKAVGTRRSHEPSTDAILSPQTASALFTAAMGGHSTCLSPAIPGSAAAQLLSPSAFGFPSIVPQDHATYYKRATSHPSCASPTAFTCNVEAPQIDLQHIQSPHFLAVDESAYGTKHLYRASCVGQAKGPTPGLQAADMPTSLVGTTGTTDSWRACLRSVQPHSQQLVASSGTKTPRLGDLVNAAQVLQHVMSPLSPGDLLLHAMGVAENSNDRALFASYGAHQSAYDCDLAHADLRLEAGAAKRVKR